MIKYRVEFLFFIFSLLNKSSGIKKFNDFYDLQL